MRTRVRWNLGISRTDDLRPRRSDDRAASCRKLVEAPHQAIAHARTVARHRLPWTVSEGVARTGGSPLSFWIFRRRGRADDDRRQAHQDRRGGPGAHAIFPPLGLLATREA